MIRPRRHAAVFLSRIGRDFERCSGTGCAASLAGLRCTAWREGGALKLACRVCLPFGVAPTRSAS